MFKIISIAGARPQFIKTAVMCRVINNYLAKKLNHKILHTGQHYDKSMSSVFFEELEMDTPAYHLNIHTNNNLYPIDEAVAKISAILKKESPDMLLVYGDTYSTLAGALASENCNIPIAHIEAGLRSYDLSMPEEYNRIETDKRATYLFCPTITAVQNLINENYYYDAKKPYCPKNKDIILSGDIMYDNAIFFKNKEILIAPNIKNYFENIPSFILCTIHRQHNTDESQRFKELLQAFVLIANQQQHILFPIHPRTDKMLKQYIGEDIYHSFTTHPYIHIIKPLSYFEMMYAEQHATLIITDSGGVQKEAYFYQKPCIIVRDETEWVELLEHKSSILSTSTPEVMLKNYYTCIQQTNSNFPPVFGNGQAALIICKEILRVLNQ